MLVRQAMLLFNIGLFAVVLTVDLLVPVYSTYIFYGLLGWIVASLFLYRLPVMNRRVGGGFVASGSTPLASGNPTGPPSTSTGDLGFCIHCGTMVPAGTPICPSCGRPTNA
jgi:hypothetical protein